MSRDYYSILGVTKKATADEIKRAYKKMALLYHPDRNTDNQEQATKKFKEIGEAYEALSDPQKRSIYDRYGEAGLKRGGGNAAQQDPFGGGHGGGHGGGQHNPFGGGNGGFHFNTGGGEGFDFFEELFRGGGSGFGRSHRPRQTAPIEKIIPVTLEELFIGTSKRVKVVKKRGDDEVTEIIPIEIKPGYRDGMKITLQQRGNEVQGMITGDINFIISEKAHGLFKREKDNLVYMANISIKHALLGLSINILMPNGKEERFDIAGPIDPNYVHMEKGHGMPVYNGYGRGDLYIKFTYLFPKKPLSTEKKEEIEKLFDDVEFEKSGNSIMDIVSNSIFKIFRGAGGYFNYFIMFALFWYFLSLSGSSRR
jgi:DnaJ family protein B protein 4